MTGLRRRIDALEAATGGSEWSDILDRLPDCDLERLESILDPFPGIEALSDSDAAFLVSISAMNEGAQ
jgi:hypothetical protein